MRPSLTREIDALAARAKLIRTLFAHRDGSVRLRKWLVALHGEVLMDAFENEPGLADERDNFEDLLAATEKGGVLQPYTIEIFRKPG